MTWLAMAYIYLPVVVFPTKQAFGPHDINLYILGMLSQVRPGTGTLYVGGARSCAWEQARPRLTGQAHPG